MSARTRRVVSSQGGQGRHGRSKVEVADAGGRHRAKGILSSLESPFHPRAGLKRLAIWASCGGPAGYGHS